MPVFQRILLLLTFAALSACDKSAPQSTAPPPAPAPAPETAPAPTSTAVYPSFKVDLQLSTAALERLASSGDKIGVSFEFGTDLGPESTNTVSKYIELTEPGVIDTDTFALAPEAVTNLGAEYEVQASGYSVSEKNLNFLDCAIVVGNISSLRDRTHVMACELLTVE